MKKSLDILRIVCCLAAAVLLWGGCDDSPQKAVQAPAVRKKVTAKDEPAPAAVAAPAPAAAGGVPSKSEPASAAPPAPASSAPAPAPAEEGPDVTESQVAGLLNIKVPPPYEPKGKVDPFLPLVKDEPAAAAVAKVRSKADPNRPKTPLERLDLGQLKLVAIIAAPTGNRAMVEESSGKGYIIRTGTLIGLNSGKVVGIQDGKVLIEEEFEDVYGKTIIQKKEITLPKPPGEL